jgi:lipopolysaccharide export system protein LptA
MANVNVTLATKVNVFYDPTQPTNKIVYKGETVVMKKTAAVTKAQKAGGITVAPVGGGGGGA